MEKSKKIMITVIAIWVIVAIAIGLIMLLANKEKTSITATQFKNTMEQKEYIIVDAKSQFSQYDYIRQVYIAGSNNYSYQIEFYELSDATTALGFYNNNVEIFQSSKGSAATETNINGKNFSKYTLSSNGKYMVISRINNTVIYLSVNDKYKNEVKNILDELGY